MKGTKPHLVIDNGAFRKVPPPPKWLPDGSGIDPLTIDQKTVVEVEWSNGNRTSVYNGEGGFKVGARDVSNSCPWGDGRIVRVFADVTPPRPDPRVEVVARVLREERQGLFNPERDARTILAAPNVRSARRR